MIWAIFASFCEAQTPEGWKKLPQEKGGEGAPPDADREKVEPKKNGVRFLGSWERMDGKVVIEVGTFQDLPAMPEILGMRLDNAADPSDFPVRVESLKKPLLGMRFWFDQDGDGREEMERILVVEETGGRLVAVELQPEATFDLKAWIKAEKPHAEERILRLGFDARAAEMTILINNPPTIGVDSKLEPPVGGAVASGNHMKVEVTVLDGPKYQVEGIEKTEEELNQFFKEAVKKAARRKDTNAVLYVRAEKQIEFSTVRILIRLAAKAGIEQVAYGSFSPKKGD